MLFYTQLFTSKRGPLARIWLAAHWERKLTKAHVFECNLESTIRDIMSPTMTIGLRTSGHLLLGVVRIYSRKAKYLLADCNDSLLKIKMAFRPGQTDLPVEGLEATMRTITLMEDFTAFDSQLPPLSDIDVVDHFSLNQSRLEEITLKEDFGNGFLTDIRGESKSHQLDMSFHSLTQLGDAFGDEDNVFDLVDFLTNSSDPAESSDFEPRYEKTTNVTLGRQQDVDGRDPVTTETSTLDETTLVSNDDEAFALEPVTVTPNPEEKKKKGKRKRRLVVDQKKELSNVSIRQQLSDYSDVVVPLDMAPPTMQLMQWKQSGGAASLFVRPCSSVAAPQIHELFATRIFQVKCFGVHQEEEEEEEMMRQDGREVEGEVSGVTDDVTVVDSSVDFDRTHDAELTSLDPTNQRNNQLSVRRDETRSEVTHPELPPEDATFVHPSHLEQETPPTSLNTQSVQDRLDSEERRITGRAQQLLHRLKSRSVTSFSLRTLCEGNTRSQAASTFFCLLVLKKQQALQLHQSAPYQDVQASLGPAFYHQLH